MRFNSPGNSRRERVQSLRSLKTVPTARILFYRKLGISSQALCGGIDFAASAMNGRDMERRLPFEAHHAVLVVDVQNDFCPGGSLPVTDGDVIVPLLNDIMAQAQERGVPICASRDWHPEDHISFSNQGGPWPRHCVQDTEGAAFHPDLRFPSNTIMITKGTRFDKDQYSAFEETGFAEFLRKRNVKCLWIGGLAEDVCVRATALDARREGFDVYLVKSATRPVTPEGGEKALADMREAGVIVDTDLEG